MKKELAKIRKAGLEIQERGILNFWIHVDYESGCSQGVGGYALDTYNPARKEREGTAYGCEIIRQLLLCLNVNDFSEMAGKNIWVLGEGEGLSFKPKGIQRLSTDKGSDKHKAVIFEDVAKSLLLPANPKTTEANMKKWIKMAISLNEFPLSFDSNAPVVMRVEVVKKLLKKQQRKIDKLKQKIEAMQNERSA